MTVKKVRKMATPKAATPKMAAKIVTPKVSTPKSKKLQVPAAYSFPEYCLSDIAKKMMETKHCHSAKCLLLPPASPLHYDSPLLRRSAKAAALSAEALLSKLEAAEKIKAAKGERRRSAGDEVGDDKGKKGLNKTLDSTSTNSTRSKIDDEDVNCTVFEVEEWGSKVRFWRYLAIN